MIHTKVMDFPAAKPMDVDMLTPGLYMRAGRSDLRVHNKPQSRKFC